MQQALAAVLANPWSDSPRELFAARVAASDPDRAKFVLAQLKVAESRREAGVRTRAVEFSALGAGLLGLTHGMRWQNGVAPLLGFDGKNGAPWRYRRGFIEEITVPAAHFLKVAAPLYARAPVLDLVLGDGKAHARAIFASPHLARIRSLDLSNSKIGDAEVALLVQSPHLARLRWLSLYFNEVTDKGVEMIAAARTTLPALRFVRLDDNPCRDPNPAVDEEDGRTYGLERSARGEELIERFGPLPWIGDNPSSEAPDPETF